VNKQVFHDRIKGVEDEFVVSQFALLDLKPRAASDPTILGSPGRNSGHLFKCIRNLEATYVIRLFAEFEAAIRTLYMKFRKKPRLPTTKIRIMMDLLAANPSVPPDVLTRADEVRNYRNSLVHEGEGTVKFTLGQCRSHLCRFLHLVPDRR
jgi:hypothetical protein